MTSSELKKQITLFMGVLKWTSFPVAYVSGKVTGLPAEEVKAKFKKKQDELEGQGYVVFNPVQWIPVDCNWQMAMRVCVSILPVCDSIHMLDDWTESKGAIEEHRLAQLLGLGIYKEV